MLDSGLPLAPHTFVRGLTAGLALFWSARGALRIWRGVVELDRIAERFGLAKGLVRRVAWRVLLRSTILDPLNASLMAAIVAAYALGEWL
jgi:hypothetical protein